jgi:hypothetical protein
MRADAQTDRRADRRDEAKPILAIQRKRLTSAVGTVRDGGYGHTKCKQQYILFIVGQ